MTRPYREDNVEIKPELYLSPEDVQIWEHLNERNDDGTLTKEEQQRFESMKIRLKRDHDARTAQLDRIISD